MTSFYKHFTPASTDRKMKRLMIRGSNEHIWSHTSDHVWWAIKASMIQMGMPFSPAALYDRGELVDEIA